MDLHKRIPEAVWLKKQMNEVDKTTADGSRLSDLGKVHPSVMVGRSLVEGGRGKVSVEMFNPMMKISFHGRTPMQYWYIRWRWKRIPTPR